MVRPLLVDALRRSGSSRTIVDRTQASAEWDNSSLLRAGGTEAAIRGAPPWAGGDLAPDAEAFFHALWTTFTR